MHAESLGNAPISGQMSIGGVQGKIMLSFSCGEWYRTHYGQASSHILMPLVARYPTMIYDEAYCMQLAKKVGLTRHPAWIEEFAGLPTLVIERYDRGSGLPGGRLHQEDFNQALGACGNQKYQESGGKVSAKRIAQCLARHAGNSAVEDFAALSLFAVAIGNLDLHAKNISVLHHPDGSISLAPAYDQVPFCHLDTDGRMALAVGGEYQHAQLTLRHLVEELLGWRLPGFFDHDTCESFVIGWLLAIRAACECTALPVGAYPRLPEPITRFTTNLLHGEALGVGRRI
jgi:serine/threonine-protein kinase HipA